MHFNISLPLFGASTPRVQCALLGLVDRGMYTQNKSLCGHTARSHQYVLFFVA